MARVSLGPLTFPPHPVKSQARFTLLWYRLHQLLCLCIFMGSVLRPLETVEFGLKSTKLFVKKPVWCPVTNARSQKRKPKNMHPLAVCLIYLNKTNFYDDKYSSFLHNITSLSYEVGAIIFETPQNVMISTNERASKPALGCQHLL